MKNFSRAIGLALRYRLTLAGAVACSLMVGMLWGGNISAVYPFVEVVFSGKSLRHWVDDEIAQSQAKQLQLRDELAELRSRYAAASADERASLASRINGSESRLAAEIRACDWAVWLRPWIYAWLPGDPFLTLVLVVAALIAGTILKNLFLVGNLNLVERLAQAATLDLRRQFYRRTLEMDLGRFSQDRCGELMSRFTYDMGALNQGLSTLFGTAVREPLKMLACLIGAAVICWRLLLLSLILAPLAALLINFLARSIKRASRRAMEQMSQLYGLLEETFGGIQVVKAYTMEEHERRRFDRTALGYYRRSMRIALYNSLTKPVTELLGIGVISIAILAGAYLVLHEETHLLGLKICNRPLSLGALLMFYGLLIGVSDPARKLSDIFAVIQKGAAAADRIYATMDRTPTIQNPPAPRPLPRPHRNLVFERVSFHYVPEQPVLQEIELAIPAGASVALVGPNGCGKTTLVNLIPRFYDPTAGAVRIGGVDLRDAALEDLRRRIGLVTQQTLLFDDTVAENIRYGTPHATRDEIVEAARKAHAHRFIVERLEQGYDTLVGSSGGRLSGGQRQRIALARAILRDPEILLLDEATSQIDLESEQLIHQALQRFLRGRTTIMITHRLSTLALADWIVVLDAGRILDQGAHEELLRRCEVYQRLHEIQLKRSA